MNVLYLANHFNVGGITSYVLSLAGGFKRLGDNVYVASSGGELTGRLESDSISHIRVPLTTKSEASPKIWLSLWKLRPLIREKNITVIHANTRVTQVLAWLLSRTTGRPYVSTCHGFFRPRFFRRILPLWGKKVIAISREVEGHLKADFGLTPEKVRLVYHGIDTERFRDISGIEPGKIKQEFGLGPGPVASIIARLSDVKGHRYLLEAMAEVVKKIPEAKVVIAGEGRMGPELRKLAATLGLGSCAVFLPSAGDTRRILGITDVFVMPSLNEGLGLGVMEAMAAGCAVIGSDVGGLRSLIRNRITGILVKPADPGALAQALLELFFDQPLRRKLGSAAAVFIAENFSLNKMVNQTKEVYQECLDHAG